MYNQTDFFRHRMFRKHPMSFLLDSFFKLKLTGEKFVFMIYKIVDFRNFDIILWSI
jgi:hypothetical protein